MVVTVQVAFFIAVAVILMLIILYLSGKSIITGTQVSWTNVAAVLTDVSCSYSILYIAIRWRTG